MTTALPKRSTSFSEELGVSKDGNAAEGVGPSGCAEHPDRAEERVACAASFRHFLHHWRFVDRETGDVLSFANLWVGQEDAVAQMEREPWLFLLKAGKLGFTELECAFDGWVALYRQPNAHVNLFSLDGDEAKTLLAMVRFGITHLPSWLGLPVMGSEPGGDTTKQLKLLAGRDDQRVITSYATTKTAGIAVTAVHSHVDELARMPWPEDTWAAVSGSVAPGGSVHVVSRGAGEENYTADLFAVAEAGESPLRPFFAPWTARPRFPTSCGQCRDPSHQTRCSEAECECDYYPSDPGRAWYEEQAATMHGQQLSYFAPNTAEEALAGSAEDAFVPLELWDLCVDDTLPPLVPGDGTPVIVSLDAGVTNDHFGAAIISRHPAHPDNPAVRAIQSWKPEDFPSGRIDFDVVESWIRTICGGGCAMGHPTKGPDDLKMPRAGCPACEAGSIVPALNVVQVCYDPYQLHGTMTRLSRDRVAWCKEFNQQTERLESDSDLRLLIMQRRLSHTGDPTLREHVRSAKAKIDPKEDTKLRIVKRSPKSKVDLVVAVSMGVARALYLQLAQRQT